MTDENLTTPTDEQVGTTTPTEDSTEAEGGTAPIVDVNGDGIPDEELAPSDDSAIDDDGEETGSKPLPE